jgi:SAM-dependent methyltransferase
MTTERDYLLGTHDAEIERLGLQHRVWRPRALDAWRRAGFTLGQTLLDVGCGPGYATLDLAEIVGPAGRVVSVDRSHRFLEHLDTLRRRRGLQQIETHELDLEEAELPACHAHGAWGRWVFAFLKRPRALVRKVAASLRPGGTLVLHEYLHYATWQLSPRSRELEELVRVVMEAWRADGGEPDVGLDLLSWLPEDGFEIQELRTLLDVVPPSSFVWHWPKSFIDVGLERLVQLGRLTAPRAAEIRAAFHAAERDPRTQMVTPAVIEILALRR